MSGDVSSSSPARAEAVASPVTDARRQVTILFVDIADSTALFSGLDPEDAAELIHGLLQTTATIVGKHGGTVDKFLGDGMMAKFGAPLAVEDAATRALRAALEIRERAEEATAAARERLGWRQPIRLHIGLDTGLVAMSRIVTDDTAMGERVVGAARVMAKSAGNEVLVGEGTMLASRDEFVFEATGNVDLSKVAGKHGTIPCYRLVSAKGASGPDAMLGTHRPASSSIVGRLRERQAVEAFASAARSGSARILLVTGDAGQGKTRLLVHLRTLVDSGVDLIVEACREEERYAQHAPLIRLLDRWAEEDPEELSWMEPSHRQVVERMTGRSDQEAEPLQEGTIRATVANILERRSRRAPVLIILDDAHWSDDASLRILLRAIGDAELDLPVSLAVAARPEAAERILAGAGTGAGTIRGFDHVPLAGLAIGDAVDLIGRLSKVELSPGAARRLAQIADGNPFCMEEVVLSLNARKDSLVGRGALTAGDIDDIHIPVRVEDIVLTRVAALDDASREVLEAASVIGESFDLRILETVVGRPGLLREVIDRLTEAAFLRLELSTDAANCRFLHSYRRAAVYQSLTRRRRSALHLATATAFRAEAGEDLKSHAALLAHHYAAAGADAEAEEALLIAGTWAVHSAAGVEAQRHLERAKELYLRRVGERVDRSHLRMLEKNLGLARLLSGDLVGSVENFDAALRLLGLDVPDGHRRRLLYGIRDFLGAVTHIRFGTRRKPWLAREDQRELFEILYNRCRAQNPTDAERSAFDNFAAIRQLTYLDQESVPGAASLYASSGAFFAFAGLDFSNLPTHAITRARAILDPADRGAGFEVDSMAFVVRHLRGEWNDEDLIDEETLGLAMERGLLWNLDVYLGLACERHIKRGRYAEARAMIRRLEALRDRVGYTFAASNIEANTAYLHLERCEYAEAHAAAVRFAASRDEATLRVIALSTQARAAMGLGDVDGASEAMGLAVRLVASSGRMPPYYLSAYWTMLLEAALSGVEPPETKSAAPSAARIVKPALKCAAYVARDRPLMHRLAARVALRSGDRRRASNSARIAWTEASLRGMLPEQRQLAELFAGECAEIAVSPGATGLGADWGEVMRSVDSRLESASRAPRDAADSSVAGGTVA